MDGLSPGVIPDDGPVVVVRDAFCLHPLPGRPDGPGGSGVGAAVAALRGLTLSVASGEKVVIQGPNGAGKTTLLRVLAGEQRLSAGTALVAGLDLAAATASELAAWRGRALGRVDQHPFQMLRPELDVLGNVALQLRLAGTERPAAEQAARRALDRLGLGSLADRRPEGLSGGEAQRVAVCAALAHGPRLVLADEPTGELDAEAAAAVYDALALAVEAAAATLVLVSHDSAAARVADRVLGIRDGRLSDVRRPGPDGAAGSEVLVLDDRGWLRLPEVLRREVGVGTEVSASVEDQAVVLVPHPSAGDPQRPSERRSGQPARPRPVHPPAGGPVAQLSGVVKGYPGRPVLRGVDLEVLTGELLVVQGRSGAGKSTLLRLMVGLDRPEAGRIEVDGVDLSACDRAALARLRRHVAAVVTQDVYLAEASDVAANLELARTVRGLPAEAAEVNRWLEVLGLGGLRHRPVRVLSGGERQRVAVARALATRPRLVVLDEPTSQLDEAGAETLAAVLVSAAAEGTAVVVATHDPVLIEAAGRVMELEGRGVPIAPSDHTRRSAGHPM
jgi:ABC-type lipoprotein export system ATPase subunit